jgi:hypothetical protein
LEPCRASLEGYATNQISLDRGNGGDPQCTGPPYSIRDRIHPGISHLAGKNAAAFGISLDSAIWDFRVRFANIRTLKRRFTKRFCIGDLEQLPGPPKPVSCQHESALVKPVKTGSSHNLGWASPSAYDALSRYANRDGVFVLVCSGSLEANSMKKLIEIVSNLLIEAI